MTLHTIPLCTVKYTMGGILATGTFKYHIDRINITKITIKGLCVKDKEINKLNNKSINNNSIIINKTNTKIINDNNIRIITQQKKKIVDDNDSINIYKNKEILLKENIQLINVLKDKNLEFMFDAEITKEYNNKQFIRRNKIGEYQVLNIEYNTMQFINDNNDKCININYSQEMDRKVKEDIDISNNISLQINNISQLINSEMFILNRKPKNGLSEKKENKSIIPQIIRYIDIIQNNITLTFKLIRYIDINNILKSLMYFDDSEKIDIIKENKSIKCQINRDVSIVKNHNFYNKMFKYINMNNNILLNKDCKNIFNEHKIFTIHKDNKDIINTNDIFKLNKSNKDIFNNNLKFVNKNKKDIGVNNLLFLNKFIKDIFNNINLLYFDKTIINIDKNTELILNECCREIYKTKNLLLYNQYINIYKEFYRNIDVNSIDINKNILLNLKEFYNIYININEQYSLSNQSSNILKDNSNVIYLEVIKRWWILSATSPTDKKILPYDYNYNNSLFINDRCQQYGNLIEQSNHPISFMPYLEDDKGIDVNYGLDEIELSIEIMIEMTNIVGMIVQHSASQFANCSGQEAIEFIMEVILKWLNLETTIAEMNLKNSREHYLRTYRWIRWEAEKVWFIADKDHSQDKIMGVKYSGILFSNLIDYIKNHHFDIVPLWRNLKYMDIERQFNNRQVINGDLIKDLDKLKKERHYMIETQNFERKNIRGE